MQQGVNVSTQVLRLCVYELLRVSLLTAYVLKVMDGGKCSENQILFENSILAYLYLRCLFAKVKR